jgi:hypothetical protein
MYWKLVSSSSLDEWIDVDLPVRLSETELHEEFLEPDHEATAGVATDASVTADAADAAILASTAADAWATAAADAARAALTPSNAACAPRKRSFSSVQVLGGTLAKSGSSGSTEISGMTTGAGAGTQFLDPNERTGLPIGRNAASGRSRSSEQRASPKAGALRSD